MATTTYENHPPRERARLLIERAKKCIGRSIRHHDEGHHGLGRSQARDAQKDIRLAAEVLGVDVSGVAAEESGVHAVARVS